MKFQDILCWIGIHKWAKSPKIIRHHIITDKHCDAIYKCENENCNKMLSESFNAYTGEVYNKNIYTKSQIGNMHEI